MVENMASISNYSLKNIKKASTPTCKPTTSLSTLIVWNVTKALEHSPTLDIKAAVISAQTRLEEMSDADDIQAIMSENPSQRHLACALLAWQKLGHGRAESLCQFVEAKMKKDIIPTKKSSDSKQSYLNTSFTRSELKMIGTRFSSAFGSLTPNSVILRPRYEEEMGYSNLCCSTMGPVVKLPVETKLVMRMENDCRGCRSNAGAGKGGSAGAGAGVGAGAGAGSGAGAGAGAGTGAGKNAGAGKGSGKEAGKDASVGKGAGKGGSACACSGTGKDAGAGKGAGKGASACTCDGAGAGAGVGKGAGTGKGASADKDSGKDASKNASKDAGAGKGASAYDSCIGGKKKTNEPTKDISTKIQQACCLDKECGERLAAMGATNNELRQRAGNLARREAERIELIERAEAAWTELERGLERRLKLATEKLEDLEKQLAKTLEERNAFKDSCPSLTKELNDKTLKRDKERIRLTEIEKMICERACKRMKLGEEAAKGDGVIAEQAIKLAQMERDNLFKEEQARFTLQKLQTEVESARMINLESERATHSELSTQHEQLQEISKELLEEDARNEALKAAVEESRKEKMEIIEDLEGCRVQCDGYMQGKQEVLSQKIEVLRKLREKVMECRCQRPVEKAIQAKRTPSFAALCKCTPEDNVLEACSCTSMRTQLLSNLFEDLFNGLQFEMAASVTQMPCQMLKCLEDKHNWDRGSAIKTNLKNYFSKILLGELDIAISTAIENYHVKWVGMSCADPVSKMTPGPDDNTDEDGWQKRAIEKRAQKLATKLAEQLFKERAEAMACPPPCGCDERAKMDALCTCAKLSRSSSAPKHAAPVPRCQSQVTTMFVQNIVQDVKQRRPEKHDHKEGLLKTIDLKAMENKLDQFIQLSLNVQPERDTKNETVKISKKTLHKGAAQGDGKKNDVPTKNGTGNSNDVNATASIQNDSPASSVLPITPSSAMPLSVCLQRAMKNVAQLRRQIQTLKKESIKKEDLKMMEDKITSIINRTSENVPPSNTKTRYLPDNSATNESIKTANRAMNHPDYSNTGKTAKRKNLNTFKETRIKSNLNRSIKKIYKKYDPTYAVNVCLCSPKLLKQNSTTDTKKYEKEIWRKKFDEESVSPIWSTKSKPINNSSLIEDTSTRTYLSRGERMEDEERFCPSGCACFHKIPSNTSLDKLLDTLSKWKKDLNASLSSNTDRKTSCWDFSKTNAKCSSSPYENLSFQSRTNIHSKIRTPDVSAKRLSFLSSNQISLYQTKVKCYGKQIAKATEPMINTDSEYMGAVNLDKSNDELCKCDDNIKNIKRSFFKCISPQKCSCERILESRKNEGQVMCFKKEKQKEINIIKTKQDRKAKDIIVVDNTPKIIDKKRSKAIEKDMNSRVNHNDADIKNTRPLKNSEYEIKFLGVTLVDVKSPVENQPILKTNQHECTYKTIIEKNAESCEESSMKSNKDTECKQDLENYRVVDYSNFNNIVKQNADSMTELHNFLDNNDKDKKNLFEKDSCIKCHQQQTPPICVEGGTVESKLQKNTACKDENRDFMTAQNQNMLDERHNNMQYQNRGGGHINSNFSIQENMPCKGTYVTVCSKNQQINKTYKRETNRHNLELDSLVDANSLKDFSLADEMEKKKLDSEFHPCKCTTELEELKKNIHSNFVPRNNNEDTAIEVQSLNYFKKRDESCVCCNRVTEDNCKDLEDNTFQLLQEYLKKKLGEFKAKSCSSICITPKEEENFYGIIIDRVKRLISESTHKITCKCSSKDGKPQGSWNRAYGLLQEYLKIKIRKVQCSCILTEDNKDTILPDVLDKVSNLIESDFQRLKNLCCCTDTLKPMVNKNNSFDKNIVKEVPVKDSDMLLLPCKQSTADLSHKLNHVSDNCSSPIQITPSNYLKQCILPQLSIPLQIENKTGNPQLTAFKRLDESVSTNSLIKYEERYSSSPHVNELLNETKLTPSDDSTKKKADIKIQQDKNICENIVNFTFGGNLKDSNSKANCMTTISKSSESEKMQYATKDHNYITGMQNLNELTIEPKISTKDKFAEMNDLINSVELQAKKSITNNLQVEEIIEPNQDKDSVNPRIPYIGYTINCTCDSSVGPHICPKNIPKLNTTVINSILQKSVPDETYFNKISYVINQPMKNTVVHKENVENMGSKKSLPGILKRAPIHKTLSNTEATCNAKFENLILKQSPTNIVLKSHIETNTLEDNASVDTNFLICDDALEWGEYTSHLSICKDVVDDQLKQENSIYFPVPIMDADNYSIKETISNENFTLLNDNTLQKHDCDCEKVPICRVKMLVDNIENKLVNSNCTCDSMTPKVCPIHSIMC